MKYFRSVALIYIMSLALLGCHHNNPKQAPITPSKLKVKKDQSIKFVSDSTWDTIDTNGVLLGKAQNVYLNDTIPSPCPPGARNYHYPIVGTIPDLSVIPGAHWIWGPESIMKSIPASNSKFTFRKKFELQNTPNYGVIYIAADDGATVEVNGIIVGGVGSETNFQEAVASQQQLRKFDICNLLHQGKNEIVIHGVNGPSSFSSNSLPDSWSNNPAWAVFGGYIHCPAQD